MELNKIYLGDAYELIKDIADKSIDCVMMDPPYDIKGIHGSGIMATRKAGSFAKEIERDKLDVGIKFEILEELVRVMKHINIYIWCNKSLVLPLLKYFVEEKKCNHEILFWGKLAPMPFCGTHYLCDKEYCLYFWEKDAPVYIPLERANTFYITNKNLEDKHNYNHPTIKPLNIIENLIANSTEVGGVVLDPFMGSGTTAVACKHLKRQFIGFEINERYYKIALDRLEGFNQKGVMNLFDIDIEENKKWQL